MNKLCFDPKDDEKLARGWPNMIAAVDGLPQDKSPAKAAMKAHRANDPVHFAEWPRLTLLRYLRIEVAATMAKSTAYDARQAEMLAIAEKAAENATPPTSAEVLEGVGRMFDRSDEIYPFQTYAFVYGAETVAGTDAVLGALVDRIGAMKNFKSVTSAMTNMAATLAFLLLRASPAAAKGARVAIKKAHVKLAPLVKGNDDAESLVRALDFALRGTAAVRTAMGDYVMLDGGWGLIERPPIDYADDAAYVRELVASAETKDAMSVRVAWLGGQETLAGLSKRKWPAAQMPSIVRDFGMIRDPEIVSLMLSLIGKTSVKDAPLAWFRAHADYVEPILAKDKSANAKSISRQLR